MPQHPDYRADIVLRTPGTNLRVATFNVENLFSRPIAMDYEDFATGQPYLDAWHELNTLFAKPVYTETDKQRILELMSRHNLTAARPRNKHLEFRKIRGQLLGKRDGHTVVVADGRADWVGWIELKKREVNDRAILNTARVIAAVDADVLALCEIEDRAGLMRFHDNVLVPILEATGRAPYGFGLVVDGNDPRGIDVAILSRHPIGDISTHIFDLPGAAPIYARDCCEYFVELPGDAGRLLMMINHFTSRGSDRSGMQRRVHQARRTAAIVDQRLQEGVAQIIVAGDLNDTPDSQALAALTSHRDLRDAIAQFAAQIDPSGVRLGTYETGRTQFDYLLMSPAVQAAARSAGIERRGTYAPRTWTPFDSVRSSRDAASDHHCVWVDLAV